MHEDERFMFGMGERDGQIIISFPKPITELVFNPENARQTAEALARYAYQAHTGLPPEGTKSMLSETIRRQLHVRAERIINSMMKDGKTARVIAFNVVDQILKEVT